MTISKAKRNQIENEMIFRRQNEQVSDGLNALDSMHLEDGNPHLVSHEDLVLQFICECSDENCDERIPLKLSDYKEVHFNRHRFVIAPDHQVDPIETVVKEKKDYMVVEKMKLVPEPGSTLRATTIDNSSR